MIFLHTVHGMYSQQYG